MGAVTTRADGSPYEGFVGYNIYRGTEKGRESGDSVEQGAAPDDPYKDTAVVNNKTYYYFIGRWTAPLSPGRKVSIRRRLGNLPRLDPACRPTGLTVVPGVARIFLTWNENREQDMAGYHVYRSRKSGRDYERLTEKPIDRTTFSDDR